ncbi:DUF2610 domain-containing protein, partial [Nostoc sp. UCD122]|nr:DUF2610 domain-containing protein [Nostoc sp. UCD122]
EQDIKIIGRQEVVQNISAFVERAQTAIEEARDRHAFEAEHLARGVTAFAERLKSIAIANVNKDVCSPYKGLLSYNLNDAELFFGRKRAISEMLQCLQRGRLTVLQAESGSGKSSLLQAGIAPRLIAAGHLPVNLRSYNTPPSLKIKQAFLPNLALTPNLAESSLREFLHQVTGVLGQSATLYLLLDQFEEFFTLLKEESDRITFINDLADCLEDDSLNVRWVLALRSEFFGNLANFRPRIKNPFDNDYRLNRLTLAEAEAVIVEPAIQQGVSFELSLVDQLLADLKGQDNEITPPQIQLVCSSLYQVFIEQQAVNPHVSLSITQQMYEEEGRAEGILRGHLNQVLERTLPTKHERELARQLLIALVSSERHRIRRTRSNLAAMLANYIITVDSLDNLLAQLVESRLINVEKDKETDEASYELAHDYLLDEIDIDPEVQAQKAAQELLNQEVEAFKRFSTLLNEDKYNIINSQREFLTLDETAEDLLCQSQNFWERETREKEAQRQRELEQAQELAEAQRKQADIQTRNAKQLRRFTFGLGGTLLLALAGMGSALVARDKANQNLAEMTKLISEVSEVVQGEKSEEIIGFAPIQKELFELFLPYHDYIIQNNQSSNFWQSAEAHYRIGSSSEKIGDSIGAQKQLRLAFEKAKAATEKFSASGTGTVPPKLLQLLNEIALSYAWNRMNYGYLDEAESILSTANSFVNSYTGEQSPELIRSIAGLENGLSRLYKEKNDDEKSLKHQRLSVEFARKAVSLDKDDVRFKGTLAVYVKNLSLTPESLMPTEEADRYQKESCEIVKVDRSGNFTAAFVNTIVNCAYDESLQGTPDENIAKLLDVRGDLNFFVRMEPSNVEFKLLRAYITSRLINIEKFQRGDKEAANRYFNMVLTDWLDVVGNGNTLPVNVSTLKTVYTNIRDHLISYDSAVEKKNIFGKIIAAIGKSNDVFSDSPEIALIAADSVYHKLEGFKKESNPQENLANVNEVISRFSKTNILKDTSTYDERYAWVCGAYATRLKINYESENIEDVLEDFKTINDICLPIFEKHSFDFYLHDNILGAYYHTGKLLFEKDRFEKAKPILEYTSRWGKKEGSKLLARMYQEGLGVQVDNSRAEALETLASKQSMKRFTIPIKDSGMEFPFHVFVYQKPLDYPYKGIDDQVEWLKQARGITIPVDVADSFRKLHKIAVENNVSFPDLAAYAVGNKNKKEETTKD